MQSNGGNVCTSCPDSVLSKWDLKMKIAMYVCVHKCWHYDILIRTLCIHSTLCHLIRSHVWFLGLPKLCATSAVFSFPATCLFGTTQDCAFQCNCYASCDPDTGCQGQCADSPLFGEGFRWGGEACQIGKIWYKKIERRLYFVMV